MALRPVKFNASLLKPKFNMGKVAATDAALAALKERGANPSELLAMHCRTRGTIVGDSYVDEFAPFDETLYGGLSIVSAYGLGSYFFVVYTTGDRSKTTISLRGE